MAAHAPLSLWQISMAMTGKDRQIYWVSQKEGSQIQPHRGQQYPGQVFHPASSRVMDASCSGAFLLHCTHHDLCYWKCFTGRNGENPCRALTRDFPENTCRLWNKDISHSLPPPSCLYWSSWDCQDSRVDEIFCLWPPSVSCHTHTYWMISIIIFLHGTSISDVPCPGLWV